MRHYKRTVSKVVQNDIYDFDTLVVVGGTAAEAAKLFERKFKVACSDAGDKACVAAFASFAEDGCGYALVYFAAPRPPGFIVAHECLHVTKYIFHRAGIREESPWEAECYLHSWLVRAVGRLVW